MGKTITANGTKKNSDRTSKRTKATAKGSKRTSANVGRKRERVAAKKASTQTPSQRRTENGGYIRFTCSAPFHAKVTASAGKAGLSIVAHCLDITSKGIKAGTLAKLPSKLQDAPKNAKPYPCYVNVEMSASLRERVKKLGSKLGAPAHVIVRELVHSATKNAKPSKRTAPKTKTAKKRTAPKTKSGSATKKRGSKRTSKK